jgi:GlcNAc-P-P-Und epimerase
MSKILITGGSGFIGSHFHSALSQTGDNTGNHGQIVNLDLLAPAFPHTSAYVPGDVRDGHSVLDALTQHPCDAIIALAAEHRDFGIAHDDYFRTNEHGTRMICEAAAKTGVKKIVFLSSVAVYGGTSAPTSEATPPAPATPYGASKLAGEAVLAAWVKQDASRSVAVLRPTVVYGVNNRANMLRLLIQIDRNRYANIGRANNIKSIAYAENVVQAALFLLEAMRPGMEIYNYADQQQMTVAEISTTIAAALGKRQPLSVPYALAYTMGLPFDLAIKLTGRDLPVSTMRIKKLCTATHHKADKLAAAGFKPRFTNTEGLQRMVAWYAREKHAGSTPTVVTSSSG